MEHNVDLDAMQGEYREAVQALRNKIKVLAICFTVICVVMKIVSSDMTIWGAAGCSMGLTMGMYLPFKICYHWTGSVFSGMLWGLVLLVGVGVIFGDHRLLYNILIIGGMVLDLAWSIAKVYKLRKSLTDINLH